MIMSLWVIYNVVSILIMQKLLHTNILVQFLFKESMFWVCVFVFVHVELNTNI
jgi:hypothetical protein